MLTLFINYKTDLTAALIIFALRTPGLSNPDCFAFFFKFKINIYSNSPQISGCPHSYFYSSSGYLLSGLFGILCPNTPLK